MPPRTPSSFLFSSFQRAMILRAILLSWLVASVLCQEEPTTPNFAGDQSAPPLSTSAAGDVSTPAQSTKPAQDDSEEDINDANDFVDQILEEVQTSETIQAKISPASLGTLQYNGFVLSNALLYGVNSVYRSDNCTFRFGDSSFDVLVHLGARDLALESDWRRTWLLIPFRGKLAAKVEDVRISMDMNVDNSGTPSLRKLKVVRLSDIRITRATGASVLFNWALRSILNWAVNANKGRIIQLVETDGAMAINEAMKDLGSKLTSLNEFRKR
ncbi:hypothetical protein V5799_025716 [Amblyomma americanum]|uniref:Uncharacterized protein n=1 Tax=Amblyomma americanum TaxID=6943 RepID=A0AAQ4E8H0_AMBAM